MSVYLKFSKYFTLIIRPQMVFKNSIEYLNFNYVQFLNYNSQNDTTYLYGNVHNIV